MAELTLESLAAQLAEQKETIAAQNALITDLQGQLLQATKVEEAPKPPSIPEATVKVRNKEYKWNVAVFRFPGSDKVYTAEEAATDEKLIAQILKIEGQGLLRELV